MRELVEQLQEAVDGYYRDDWEIEEIMSKVLVITGKLKALIPAESD